MNKIKSVCPRDCYDNCFVIAELTSNDRLKAVMADPSNPITQNFTCPRGKKDPERVYTNRILYPYVRTAAKPSKNFERISWKKALNIVATRIKAILDEKGSEKLLFLDYAGNTGLATKYLPLRMWVSLGATITDYSVCSKSGHDALALHYGLSYGIQPEKLSEMKAIIFWGFNSIVSSPHQWRISIKARSSLGAKIVIIDPRKSESAKKADVWIAPKPGSDVALSYGVYMYLIDHDYVDLDFIEKWTHGYELLKQSALKWSPKKVETITGVKWSKIKQLGEIYGNSKPSTTMIGIGLQKNHAGAEMVRAVSLIPSLLGLHRGYYYSNSTADYVNYDYLTGKHFIKDSENTTNQVSLAKPVREGKFNLIFISCMNPLVTLPNQRILRDGLTRNDVFVTLHETHWTKSTEYADIVLPAPTYLEKEDLVIPWSHNYIRKSSKAIEPLGESKEEYWVMQQISQLLDLDYAWLYEKKWTAIEKSISQALEDGTAAELHSTETFRLKLKSMQEYQTPSKKIEFFSTIAKEIGINPLPTHLSLEIDEEEFVLLNSALPKYTHTQFQEIFGLIPSILHINPLDAKLLKIKDQDSVFLYNENGRIKVTAKLSEDVPIGVLWSPREFEGDNSGPLNFLTKGEPQKLGKGPKFNSVVVKIEVVS